MANWCYFRSMNAISVVTICFNNLADLKLTCQSVDLQAIKPFEHLIINGSTNTDIHEWLTKQNQPAYRQWVSEPDQGISDAFNKGVQKATGSIIHLLNAGDIYFSTDVLNMVLTQFNTTPSISWVSGNILMQRAGIWVEVGVPFDANQLFKGMRSVSHPTWFLKKSVYERVGNFSLKYKIAMDYDLMCRLINEPYLYIPKTLIRFDNKGVSTSNYLQSLKDNTLVYESHFGYSLKSRLWQIRQRMLFYLVQSNFGKLLYSIKMKFNR